MPKKWNFSFDELKTLVAGLGFGGNWEHDNKEKLTFNANSHGKLNYWPSTRTVNLQGNNVRAFKNAFETALDEYVKT